MRYLFLIAIALLLSCGSLVGHIPKSISVNHLVDRTVIIQIMCDGVKGGHGSGVISGETIYTAAHVVDSEGCSYLVEGKEVTVIKKDSVLDLALLSSPHKKTSVHVREPRLGEKIVCAGYSSQRFDSTMPRVSVTYGNVKAVGFSNGLTQITNLIAAGHSGGGCLSVKDGALVGLVVSGHVDPFRNIIPGYVYTRTIGEF